MQLDLYNLRSNIVSECASKGLLICWVLAPAHFFLDRSMTHLLIALYLCHIVPILLPEAFLGHPASLAFLCKESHTKHCCSSEDGINTLHHIDILSGVTWHYFTNHTYRGSTVAAVM